MIFLRAPIRALFLLATLTVQGQSTYDSAAPLTIVRHPLPRAPRPAQPSLNPNLIVLDPAHGGADEGARLDHNLLERDVALSFANRLRTLLIARGFVVITTHESASDDMTPDARVEIANRSHPAACLLLHAATSGHGVHLFLSALTPQTRPSSSSPTLAELAPIAPWDTAQAPVLPQSQRLASDLATGLNGVKLPLVLAQSSVRPIDSMLCPAVALELSPLPIDGSQISPADFGYQGRVAEAIVSGLVLWRDHVRSQIAATDAARVASGSVVPANHPGAIPVRKRPDAPRTPTGIAGPGR